VIKEQITGDEGLLENCHSRKSLPLRCLVSMTIVTNSYLALAAISGARLQSVKEQRTSGMKDSLEDLIAEKRKELGIKDNFPKGIEEAVDALRC